MNKLRWTLAKIEEIDQLRQSGYTLAAIGDLNGLSKERIRQVLAKYHRSLRVKETYGYSRYLERISRP